jgi:hypothetical protein
VLLPSDEDRELERVGQVQLRQVFRRGQCHEHVPAFECALKRCVRVTGRARSSSSLGAETITSLEQARNGEKGVDQKESQ